MKLSNINIDVVKYTLETEKLDFGDKKTVILIADLHGFTDEIDKSKLLAERIKKMNPHHVMIAGDIMQGPNWENKEKIGKLSYFLDDLSEESSVFVSQGNHDLIGTNKNNKDLRNANFKDLDKVRPGKIYPIINDKIFIDGFEIVGYTPTYDVIAGLSTQIHGLAHDKFIKQYQEDGVKIEPSNKQIIEFLGHNPHIIAQAENNIGLEGLSSVDTFYTGHLHNGYLRSIDTLKNPDKYLDKGYVEGLYNLNKNGKLSSIKPLFFGSTNLCRGVIYLNCNCEQRILQLSNDHYYLNINSEVNKQTWTLINKEEARKIIMNNNLKALIITGGIRKYGKFNVPNDNPEITEVTYEGIRKR